MFGFGKKHKPAPAPSPVAEPATESAPDSAPEAAPETVLETAPDAASPAAAPERPAARTSTATAPRPSASTAAWPPASRGDEPAGSGRLAQAMARAAGKARQPQGLMLTSLIAGLSRTRAVLQADINDLVAGRAEIDTDLLDELEVLLLSADVGVTATRRIIDDLGWRIKRRELTDADAFLRALRRELAAIITRHQTPVRAAAAGRPQVILMVGVNGVGKTTSIGKLARQLLEEGNSVMLAAGDTFRAAAVEQLQAWGARNRVPVIAQQPGADPASVIFDALQAATARGIDVLIADTAGRLHTKSNLMEELKKIARVVKKIDPDAPHEVMLVVDATTGQNALHQALQFHQCLPLTGITLTKLDGTARGGILFALAEQLPVPFRFIGIGEKVEDLRHFDAEEFLDALFTP